jgi:rsbT co-antagonist protein RsbR
MGSTTKRGLAEILSRSEAEILPEWMRLQLASVTLRRDLIGEAELREQSQRFLQAFSAALRAGGDTDIRGSQWTEVRNVLDEVSSSRARQGVSPAETATFVQSIKQPLFERMRRDMSGEPEQFVDEVWNTTVLVDKLALYTIDSYQRSREDLIARQQQEMLELSTPVVQLWQGVVALPLIGTLDSERTQIVMENLLSKIVETGAEIAILDITGVPTVDTLVAQHLLKTVAAARLMGAECILSGIRPQIAQTIVHLGVDLQDVITKPTIADAFAIALKRSGQTIVPLDRA